MKYKVIVEQRELFEVEVDAEGDIQAMARGENEFSNGNYKETGDITVNAIDVKQIK